VILSASTGPKCFFLDANIVISDILNENNPRIAKLKEDAKFHKIPCYISDSVKTEVYGKVNLTSNFLGEAVRKTVKDALEDARAKRGTSLTAPMNNYDVRALEDLFWICHNAARSQKLSLIGPLKEVEEWAIQFIGDKLNQGANLSVDDFLVELAKKLLETTSAIEDVYDNLVEFEMGHIKTKIIPVPKALADLVYNVGIHSPDNVHIAVAFTYQVSNNEKVVFATQDYGILGKKQELWKQKVKIELSDPLYAFYHL
jgi:predicted nucleic acid-binding protein